MHYYLCLTRAQYFIVVPFSASSEDKLGATEVCVLLSEPQTDEDEMLLVPAGQEGGLDGVLQCRHPLTDLTTLAASVLSWQNVNNVPLTAKD